MSKASKPFVVFCTVLSLPGAFLGLLPILSMIDGCSSDALGAGSAAGIAAPQAGPCASAHFWFPAALLSYAFTWVAYFGITLAWLDGRKLPRLATAGTVSALFYFMPLVATAGRHALILVGFLFLVAPAIAIAVRAVRFHLS